MRSNAQRDEARARLTLAEAEAQNARRALAATYPAAVAQLAQALRSHFSDEELRRLCRYKLGGDDCLPGKGVPAVETADAAAREIFDAAPDTAAAFFAAWRSERTARAAEVDRAAVAILSAIAAEAE